MTREELEKAIENGESMYVVDDKVIEVELNPESEPDLKSWDKLYVKVGNNDYKTKFQIDRIFKTKAEAEHYLHHANVTRAVTFPFLTWEEFNKGNRLIRFTGKNGEKCKLEGWNDEVGGLIIVSVNDTGIGFDYTEENFYKAYDECVRLFRGEEDAEN